MNRQARPVDRARALRDGDLRRVGILHDDVDVGAALLGEIERCARAERLAKHRRRDAGGRGRDLDDHRLDVLVRAVADREIDEPRADIVGRRAPAKHARAVRSRRQLGRLGDAGRL